MNRTALPTVATITYAFQLALVALMLMLATVFVFVQDPTLVPDMAYFALAGGWVALATGGRELQLHGQHEPVPATPILPKTRVLVPGAGWFDAWVTPDLRVFFGASEDVLAGRQLDG